MNKFKKTAIIIMILVYILMTPMQIKALSNIRKVQNYSYILEDSIKVTVEGEKKSKTKNKCKAVLINKNSLTGKMLYDLYNLIKFAVPIILLVMSVLDFIKAIATNNNDEIKKSTSKFIKRLIIAILILVLPTLLYFILNDLIGLETCLI